MECDSANQTEIVEKGEVMDAMKLWIVDDNPPDVFLMKLALKDAARPVDVIVLTDGENAINMIEQCRVGTALAPAIILLDLHLPKVDGFQVLHAIRSTPQFKEARVAMLTSSPVSVADPEGTVQVDRWVQKPSKLEQFLAEIGRTVRDLSESRSRALNPLPD